MKIEDLKIGKVYLCADGDKRLLLEISETCLTYGVEIKEGIFTRVSPTHKRYILNDFLNGKELDYASKVV